MINEKDLAYIAGFFDGEGCVTFRYCAKRNLTPTVVITNNRKDILSYIKGLLGGRIYKRKTTNPKHSDCFILNFTNQKDCYKFLTTISSYVKLKKIQVETTIKYIESRFERKLKRGRHLPLLNYEKNLIKKVRIANAVDNKRVRLLNG